MPGLNHNPAFTDRELFGEKLYQPGIGFAVNRRRVDSDLAGASDHARQFISVGTWLHFYEQKQIFTLPVETGSFILQCSIPGCV